MATHNKQKAESCPLPAQTPKQPAKDCRINLRCTQAELEAWRAMAERMGYGKRGVSAMLRGLAEIALTAEGTSYTSYRTLEGRRHL